MLERLTYFVSVKLEEITSDFKFMNMEGFFFFLKQNNQEKRCARMRKVEGPGTGVVTPPGGPWQGLCGACCDRHVTASGEGAQGREGNRQVTDIVLCQNGFPARTCLLGLVIFQEHLISMRRTQSSPVSQSASSRGGSRHPSL